MKDFALRPATSSVRHTLLPEQLLTGLEDDELRWALPRFSRLLYDFMQQQIEEFNDFCYQEAQRAFDAERSFNAAVDAEWLRQRDQD